MPDLKSVANLRTVTTVREVTALEETILDHLWKRMQPDNMCIVNRSGSYLRWRYFHQPKNRYLFLVSLKESEQLGYLVLAHALVSGIKFGVILDLQMKNSSLGFKAGLDLLKSAEKICCAADFQIVLALAHRITPQAKLFRKTGFNHWMSRLSARKCRRFVHLNTAERAEWLPQKSIWLTTFGDFDVF
jgi:hypothetical protein